MTKSTITRERLQEIAEDGFLKHGESKELARMALAAMDSEPAPVVPDDVSIFEAAIEECKTCDSIDEHAWNHGVLVVMAKYESCRAVMLQAKSLASINPAPALCSLSKTGEVLHTNSPVITDGGGELPS
ncbi:hypothetical protein [Klebsiella variicola]|uniref:hypothetical protein n=1 Tax=Klebsiella variicola TaxID=244366 RepID=UPI0006DA265A|nr:hypothetical protein [Klebsiella variicola]KPS42324.1 hypothetical protein AN687_01860 [Klebsiella variicola]